ncbi:MAG: ferredoxin family protein [Planctomycetes bacterium]|nr:ferredoxin family protein [Planctomycetota bacterium]
MAHVVCEPCRDCKYTDCVVVCPMECFYEDGSMLYIDPTECIDCQACIPECPVEAIFQDFDVPAEWTHYLALNAERSAALIAASEGHITEKREPKVGPGCQKRT